MHEAFQPIFPTFDALLWAPINSASYHKDRIHALCVACHRYSMTGIGISTQSVETKAS